MSKKEKKEKKQETIEMRDIGEELKDSYLDYAMSTIISRALPDARDGLKPVQRRILFAMKEIGLTSGAKSRKSFSGWRSFGKISSHGDVAVYDALVRMAQDFSLRYPLIKGQGILALLMVIHQQQCVIQARLTPIARNLEDLDKETVDFSPNYDGTRQEPIICLLKYLN